MKKNASAMMAFLLILLVFSGCFNKGNTITKSTNTNNTKLKKNTKIEKPFDNKIVRIGVGQRNSSASSTNFTQDKGAKGQLDLIICAVGLNKDGKIVSVIMDEYTPKVLFDTNGKIITDLKLSQKSKMEESREYDKVKRSDKILSFSKQMDLFTNWIEKKSLDQVLAMKTKRSEDDTLAAVPDEEELKDKVNFSVEKYVAALEAAYSNMYDVSEGVDTFGLGVYTDFLKSKSKTEDKGAVANMDTYFTISAIKDKKIVTNFMDCIQCIVTYDVDGQITTKLQEVLKTKQELKESYNLKSQSFIKKEWYEQANAFSKWVIDKDINAIKSMKVKNDDGKITTEEVDLMNSVTIDVSHYIKAIENSTKNIKYKKVEDEKQKK